MDRPIKVSILPGGKRKVEHKKKDTKLKISIVIPGTRAALNVVKSACGYSTGCLRVLFCFKINNLP
jgi:hypothetical protein